MMTEAEQFAVLLGEIDEVRKTNLILRGENKKLRAELAEARKPVPIPGPAALDDDATLDFPPAC